MHVPGVVSNSDMDVSELSAEYKQRKMIKEDVNVVKIGMYHTLSCNNKTFGNSIPVLNHIGV
jgi:hypothetical protein